MTALFVWTLIGASKKEGNGDVVEAVARFNFTFTLSTPFLYVNNHCFLNFITGSRRIPYRLRSWYPFSRHSFLLRWSYFISRFTYPCFFFNWLIPRGGYGKLVQKELEAQRQLVDYGTGSLGGSYPAPAPSNCTSFQPFLGYMYHTLTLWIVNMNASLKLLHW